MSTCKPSDGFTLIELMIVVAIIAIIAAIAIPSILRSRISANETSAQGSMDSLMKANQLFRQNDSDKDGAIEYWTADIYGLWGVLTAGGSRAEMIGAAVAGADYQYNSSSPSLSYSSSVEVWGTSPAGNAHPVPKSGYYFGMLDGQYKEGTTSGSCDLEYKGSRSYSDPSHFGVAAFPASFDSTGRKAFIVTDGREVLYIDAAETDNGLGSAFNDPTNGEVTTDPGTLPNNCVPNQQELSSSWTTK